MGLCKALCQLLGCAPRKPLLIGFYGDSLMTGTQEGADYMQGTPGDTLSPQVTALVDQAPAAGKRPVLVGVPSLLPGIGGVDALLRDVAAGMGVPFIELAHIPIGPGDQPDGIHPGQELSDRIAAEVVRQLQGVV